MWLSKKYIQAKKLIKAIDLLRKLSILVFVRLIETLGKEESYENVQKKKKPFKDFFFKMDLKLFPVISIKLEFGFKR